MIEMIVFLMQVASALFIVAGGVLVFSHVLEEEGLIAPSFDPACDFGIDHRRVLSFARPALRR